MVQRLGAFTHDVGQVCRDRAGAARMSASLERDIADGSRATALAAELPGWIDTPVGWGTVPDSLDGALSRGVFFEASRSEALITIPDIARVHVRRDAITVAPLASDAAARIGPYLRRTPFLALLMLHGGYACDGAMVASPQGALLIAGPSLSGKSSLAAALVERGLSLLADDAAPIFAGPDGRALGAPLWPELLLWPDSVRGLFGEAPAWLGPERGTIAFRDVARERFATQMFALRRIYRLLPEGAPEVPVGAPMDIFARIAMGAAPAYQAEIATALGQPPALDRIFAALDRVEVRTVRVSRAGMAEITSLADRIAEEFGG